MTFTGDSFDERCPLDNNVLSTRPLVFPEESQLSGKRALEAREGLAPREQGPCLFLYSSQASFDNNEHIRD